MIRISTEDCEQLADYRGLFEDGYTPADARVVLGEVSERLDETIVVLWAEQENDEPVGSSSFYVKREGRLIEAPVSFFTFMTNPESTVTVDELRKHFSTLSTRSHCVVDDYDQYDDHNVVRV